MGRLEGSSIEVPRAGWCLRFLVIAPLRFVPNGSQIGSIQNRSHHQSLVRCLHQALYYHSRFHAITASYMWLTAEITAFCNISCSLPTNAICWDNRDSSRIPTLCRNALLSRVCEFISSTIRSAGMGLRHDDYPQTSCLSHHTSCDTFQTQSAQPRL